jgi:integral membrane protein (TIGR01906 family)
MKNKIYHDRIIIGIFSLVLFLVLILGSINFMIFNKEFYYSQYEKNGAYKTLGVELSNNITSNTLKYFHNKAELSYFTESEKSHMSDVKKIIYTTSTIYYSAIMIIMLLFFYCYRRYKNNNHSFVNIVSKSMIFGSLAAIIFLSIIFVIAVFGFDGFFIGFHEIFFPQGNWTFDNTSLLITLFPQSFFINIGLRIFLYAMFQSLIFFGIGYYIRKKINVFEKHYAHRLK